MRIILLILISFLINFHSTAQPREFEWASQCGNPSNTTDAKTTLAGADNGYFYMAGEFLGTVQFGNKSLVSAGGTDIWLVKNTPEGAPVWSIRMGGNDDDFVWKIVSDNEDNVTMTGYYYGTIQIGNDIYTSQGSQDLFIARFDGEGNYLWSYTLGGGMADYIRGLATDSGGNLFLAGHFYDSFIVGDTTVTAARGSDAFVIKFSPDGQPAWVTTAGGSSSDQASSVTIDSEGNILLAASFYYDITFGDTTLHTPNPVGVAIARYFPDGGLDRVFQLNGTYLTTENLIRAGLEGQFYVAGNFSEKLFFGNKTFDAGEFNQDIFTAAFGQDMELLWARHGFSAASDQVVGLDTDPYGNVYIAGHYLDTIRFDQLKLQYTLCCGSREIFIVSYSSGGAAVWGEQITGARANLQSIEMIENGKMILSGMFTEDLAFGPHVLSHWEGFRNYASSLETGLITGTPEINNSLANIVLSPNPARTKIQIHSAKPLTGMNYTVFKLNGSVAMEGAMTSNSIDIQNLAPGLFLLRIWNEQEDLTLTAKFIRQ